MTDEVILQVKDLRTYFYTDAGVVKAVDGLTFDLHKGETLGLVGESGSGKSVTNLSIINLIQTPPGKIEGGEVLFYGEDLLKMSDARLREIRGDRIAMIFQDPMSSLNPYLRISTQMIETICLHQGLNKKAAKEKAIEMLKLTGIPAAEKRIDGYPHQFSGGMRQRAVIAMAMACNPRVLIADEPTTALDVTIQAQIFELMEELKTKYKTAIMLITHDMGVVTELADDVIVMYMGHIVERGTVEEVLRTPQHPYTKGLLRSIPILGKGHNQKLIPIRGSTPNPHNRPKGCQFSPRCDFCTEKCSQMPPEYSIGGTHTVRCWYAEHKEN